MPCENGKNVLAGDAIVVATVTLAMLTAAAEFALTAESYFQDSSRMFPNLCFIHFPGTSTVVGEVNHRHASALIVPRDQAARHQAV